MSEYGFNYKYDIATKTCRYLQPSLVSSSSTSSLFSALCSLKLKEDLIFRNVHAFVVFIVVLFHFFLDIIDQRVQICV